MYKVAILGCENSHARNFLNAVYHEKIVNDVEFIGVYSEEEEAAQKLHDQFGVYAAANYDEFVGKADGIIITARHGSNHYKYAKPYLESGIPMFIDKPATCTEEDAGAFMEDLKTRQIRISGGSSCVLADHVQNLKKVVEDKRYGEVYGGYLRAPIRMNSSYGGFFFYAQHLIQVAMEIFGYRPKAVQVFHNGSVYTCMLRYENYDIPLSYIDSNYQYYAMISCEKDSIGGVYGLGNCFQMEFLEFYDLLKGEAQKQSYEDFFAPVYVMNAIYRALQSGNEEPIIYWKDKIVP